MDEICTKMVESFDVDAYLNDNPHIMAYYAKKKNKKATTIKYDKRTLDEKVNFFLQFPKRPSVQYLLRYLEPAKLNTEKVRTEVLPPSYKHISRLTKYEKDFQRYSKVDEEFSNLNLKDMEIYRSTIMPTTDIRQVADIFCPKKYQNIYKSLLQIFIR
jgi:hypothetical protein